MKYYVSKSIQLAAKDMKGVLTINIFIFKQPVIINKIINSFGSWVESEVAGFLSFSHIQYR